MQNESMQSNEARRGVRFKDRMRRLLIFFAIVVVWLIVDRLTKMWADVGQVGMLLGGPFIGLVEFRLVHNTGAAWGLFGESTVALGILSVIVCLIILAYVVFGKGINLCQTVGLALVFAGGIGNSIDRFTNGYVVDFINTVFISFPTFNVADIGVTCGVVIFFIGVLLQERTGSASSTNSGELL